MASTAANNNTSHHHNSSHNNNTANSNANASNSNIPDAYSLRRSNQPLDLMFNLEKMFKEENMVDVTLSCEDGTIRAHKLILSASSSYFEKLFSKFTNPSQYPVVILKDMPFSDLRAIIDFIYRAEVTVPQEQLPSLLKSAELLKVKGLSGVSPKGHHSSAGKNSGSQEGTENGSGNGGSGRKRRRRKRKRQHSSQNQQGSDEDGGNGGGHGSARREGSSEDGSEFTDEDELSSHLTTTITPVCSGLGSSGGGRRRYNEDGGDIEPSRLLEQTMITGEVRGHENGSSSVPRYSSTLGLTSVQPMSSVSSQDVKPLMFDDPPSLIPQLSVSLAQSISQQHQQQQHHNESLQQQQQQSNSSQQQQQQNHLPPSSVSCTLSAFDTGMSIPGPSSLSHHVSRPSQPHNQEQFVGSSHSHHSQSSHPQSGGHLLPPQMHPSLGCHALTSMSVETLSGRRHYQCPVCLKAFSEKGNMKRHTQIHLQQRNRYMCDLCSKCFAWKDNFNRHRRIAHCDHNCK